MKDRRADFPDLWHTFLQRKVLTVNKPIGYVYGHLDVPCAPLRDVAASLLYIDMVSVLEAAVRTRMSGHKFDDLEDLERRLLHLRDQRALIDYASLEAIRRRRNEIAHRVVRVNQAELHSAIAVVQAQLEAWGLVGPAPDYKFDAERSQVRDATDDERAMGHRFAAYDYKVRVTLDGRPVVEHRSTEFHG